MADVKISDLTDGTAIAAGDLIEIERPGSPAVSRKIDLGAELAGLGGGITLLTPQATTSGTTKDFTIPAGAKRITVMLDAVSLTASASVGLQLGDSGGIETTGYVASAMRALSGTTSSFGDTSYFYLFPTVAATEISGMVTLTRMNNSHTWTLSSVLAASTTNTAAAGGLKTLSAELTTVRLMGGTFDNGSVNVAWE